VLRPRPISRPISVTPRSGRPDLKADRIASPRSSDCEYADRVGLRSNTRKILGIFGSMFE
jgi:hypothetical protein